MAILLRALTDATLFVGLVLVFLPAQILTAVSATLPLGFAASQLAGMLMGALGGAVAVCCVLTVAMSGRGTRAPFDLPVRLVIRGPYRYVRSPIYLGATFALTGAVLFYETVVLLAYALGFLALSQALVVLHEEPTLARTFGEDYERYRREVGRGWPKP